MLGSTLILDAFWVSNKPFPTVQNAVCHDGKIFHDYYEGEARHLGWMDLILLKEIIAKHHVNHIILRHLDTLGKIANKLGKVKVCVGYEYKKHIIHYSLNSKEIVHCSPIYATASWGGWNLSEDDEILHARAQHYIRFLLIHSQVDAITYLNNKIKFTAYFDSDGRVLFETEPNL